jgi:hypothetical protein
MSAINQYLLTSSLFGQPRVLTLHAHECFTKTSRPSNWTPLIPIVPSQPFPNLGIEEDENFMTHDRRQFRIVVERSGQLWHGGKCTPCHVCDLTEQGFLLQTTLDLSKDAIVRLQCDVDTFGSIECVLQLLHIRRPFVGGQIVEMSPAHRERLIQFVQQVIALNMAGI